MADDGRSIQELFSTAFAQVGRLLRSELQLAKAEVSASISNAGVALGLVGAGAAMAVAALVLLLQSISEWLIRSVGDWRAGGAPGMMSVGSALLGDGPAVFTPARRA